MNSAGTGFTENHSAQSYITKGLRPSPAVTSVRTIVLLHPVVSIAGFGTVLSYVTVVRMSSPKANIRFVSDAFDWNLREEAMVIGPLKEGEKLRVLIVDDNADAASTLSMVLDAMGSDVIVELRPVDALARTDVHTFDAFLLDIGLPEMDGHELARQLRRKQSAKAALFVAVTGYSSPEDRKRSAEAGFHHHFAKPVNLDALFSILGLPGSP